MKDNDISSNSIYRVSEKRREKEKMVFGEGADHQDLRVYYEGREQRRITYTVCLYTDFLWLCVLKSRGLDLLEKQRKHSTLVTDFCMT